MLRCFTIDETGDLRAASSRDLSLNQTQNPPNGPSYSASTIVFTPDQQNVVASIKGLNGSFDTDPGYLAVWSVQGPGNLSDSYTRINLTQPAGLPFSLSSVPGRQAFLGSDLATGAVLYDYSNGMDNMSLKTLSVPGQGGICWSVTSPKTNSFFLSDLVNSVITEVGLGDDLSPYVITVSTAPFDSMQSVINNVVQQYPVPETGPNEAVVTTVGENE